MRRRANLNKLLTQNLVKKHSGSYPVGAVIWFNRYPFYGCAGNLGGRPDGYRRSELIKGIVTANDGGCVEFRRSFGQKLWDSYLGFLKILVKISRRRVYH